MQYRFAVIFGPPRSSSVVYPTRTASIEPTMFSSRFGLSKSKAGDWMFTSKDEQKPCLGKAPKTKLLKNLYDIYFTLYRFPIFKTYLDFPILPVDASESEKEMIIIMTEKNFSM